MTIIIIGDLVLFGERKDTLLKELIFVLGLDFIREL